MTDREKIIKGLECAIGIRGIKNCDDCPYDNDFNCIGCDIVMRDAIALLKDQEPVAPETEVLNEIDRIYRCPQCHRYLIYKVQKYCDKCGKAVKW